MRILWICNIIMKVNAKLLSMKFELQLYFPILFFKPSHFDMSHVINGLQFGDVITVSFILISSLL